MIEESGDLWNFYKDGYWVVIPTNGTVQRRDGKAVMGAGLALDAARAFPDLPKRLGELINYGGNHVKVIEDYRMILFPTKKHWMDNSTLGLIKQSAGELKKLLKTNLKDIKICCPRVGCGTGKLSWDKVKPLLEGLDITVVSQ